MDIDPSSLSEEEHLQNTLKYPEEEIVSEISQAGQTSVVAGAPAPEKEEDTPAMVHQEVEGCQQTSDGSNSPETDAQDAGTIMTSTSTTINNFDNEEEGEEGGDDNEDKSPVTKLVWNRNRNDVLTTVVEEHDEEDEEKENIADNNGMEDGVCPDGQLKSDRSKNKRDSKGLSTKVVVRWLPPRMTRKDFIEAVSPLPEYDYVQIDNPDPEWGPSARSVAHINFFDPEDAFWFIDRFTGYRFIDEDGEEYMSLCDFAQIQKVFRLQSKQLQKGNPNRGKTEQSEEYQAFLRKCEEDPFAYAGFSPTTEVMSAEMMLEEIENKATTKGPAATPLLNFILNKKVAREAERKLRREKERERAKQDRIRRDKERDLRRAKDKDDRNSENRDGDRGGDRNKNKGESESVYRDLKRERRRERRDKERKERRDREKLEAKAKGMTVTYSKTGQVTRWSANSAPFAFAKGGKDDIKDKEPSKDTDKTVDKESSQSSSIKKLFGPSSSDPKDNSTKLPDEPVKKKPTNPFSKDIKKFDKPVDNKPKFGKPFPIKSDSKEAPSSSSCEKPENKPPDRVLHKPPFPPSALARINKETIPHTTIKDKAKPSEASADPNQPSSEAKGQKKIIKRIIRVKKVIPKSGEDTHTESKDKNGNREADSTKPKETPKPSASPTSSSSTVSKNPSGTEAKDVDGGKEKDDRRRRARPDMQIYRPGAGNLRSSANNRDKPKPLMEIPVSSSKPTDKDTSKS